MAKKRGYSRAFPTRSDIRIKWDIDRVPPTLAARVRTKLTRQHISLRTLTLTLWQQWVDAPDEA